MSPPAHAGGDKLFCAQHLPHAAGCRGRAGLSQRPHAAPDLIDFRIAVLL